ncbi:MAG: hypothetical protein H7245_02755 [Candidatus Saccharibacteria bacterium]|nr:hypothetical protein [Pseudorhodobacter sp.]
MTATDLFTRLAATHKPDCMLSLEGPPPETVPNPDELARTLGSDTVARYASACRPIYEDLRRVIGQLAGLLILARLTNKTELADLPEMTQCRARWQDAATRLSALSPPSGLLRHKSQLDSAHVFSGLVMETFSHLRRNTDTTPQLDLMSVQIKRAYAHLDAASSTKAGLQMVDFSHACCACAQ